MQAAFQFAHQALQDLVYERMEILDAEEREQEGRAGQGESAQEEVAVEEGDKAHAIEGDNEQIKRPYLGPLTEEDRRKLESLL